MLDFLKRKKSQKPDDTPKSEEGLLSFFKNTLTRTRSVFSQGISNLFVGRKKIDETLLGSLEDLLLSSDFGVETTEAILQALRAEYSNNPDLDPEQLKLVLRKQLNDILLGCEKELVFPAAIKPFLNVVVGVNGVGKTTTIGKLAKLLKDQNKEVLLAAGDTFRAAAIEQLKKWGEQNNTPVIAQHTGADSASVIFDAYQAAIARGNDILIADTAGRLHTQEHLMEELKKIVRVLRKIDVRAPHEILLILDAGIGQNALVQAKKFHEALGVTGIVLTKLDGTAKGGIIFNIAKTLKIPIRFIGTGEGVNDLKVFNATIFIDALLS